MINEILDYSKIEAGKFSLDPVDFDLRDCVGDTLKLLAVRAHDKGLELACDLQPRTLPGTFSIGDPGRTSRQILVNLIGNAIKFTSQGEVLIRVAVEDALPDQVCLHARRDGYGHRHPVRQATSDLRSLRPGGRLDHAEIRRHGPGTDDFLAAGGTHGR